MSGLIHVWHRCHVCGIAPIAGVRFECETCAAGPDRDLCANCYRDVRQGRHPHPPPRTVTGRPGAHVFRERHGVAAEPLRRWLTIPRCAAPVPVMPRGFVVRPEFHCERGSYFGSHAFVVDPGRDAAPLLLTALHVMDELIRSHGVDCSPQNDRYSGEELPRLVRHVTMYDVFAEPWVLHELGVARSMLTLPDARVPDEEPYSQRDIAAFRVDASARVSPAPLAARLPEVGDPIWMTAGPGHGAPGGPIEAVVVEATAETFIFRYTTDTRGPYFSSGAPLIDRNGHVVGINVGAGVLDRQHVGHAHHVQSIRRHLELPD
jgi:hypothetical protein